MMSINAFKGVEIGSGFPAEKNLAAMFMTKLDGMVINIFAIPIMPVELKEA